MKRAKVIRPTKEERDLRLRGECIGVATGLSKNNDVADIIRGAQLLFDWMTAGKMPNTVIDLKQK